MGSDVMDFITLRSRDSIRILFFRIGIECREPPMFEICPLVPTACGITRRWTDGGFLPRSRYGTQVLKGRRYDSPGQSAERRPEFGIQNPSKLCRSDTIFGAACRRNMIR